jgi:hypothetical protein
MITSVQYRMYIESFSTFLSFNRLIAGSFQSVHFIVNIHLQRHGSNAFTALSSCFPKDHVSDP